MDLSPKCQPAFCENKYNNGLIEAFVAQLDRALPSEGKGCWFESNRVHHNLSAIRRDFKCQTDIVNYKGREIIIIN